LDDVTKAVPADFDRPGDVLLLIDAGGSARECASREFGSSEYAKVILGALWGEPPAKGRPFLVAEAELHKGLARLASERMIHAARPISDGGIAVALAEGCFAHGVGVDVDLQYYPGEPAYIRLFSEEATQVVVACASNDMDRVTEIFKQGQPGIWKLGTVTDGPFRMKPMSQKRDMGHPLQRTHLHPLTTTPSCAKSAAWLRFTTIPRRLGGFTLASTHSSIVGRSRRALLLLTAPAFRTSRAWDWSLKSFRTTFSTS